jgi:hypothetical protein
MRTVAPPAQCRAGLPPGPVLVALVREHGPAALNRYAPEIDEYADMGTLAAWLGLSYKTIQAARSRGTWPDPAPVPGRSPLWTYRAIVLHRAATPRIRT